MESTQSTKWDVGQYSNFSSLVLDYLNKKNKNLYKRFPEETAFVDQTIEKLKNYRYREVLCGVLNNQLSELNLCDIQKKNLEKLGDANTVTITTGHQLNLLTGPVYFFYKILQIIKCCRKMNESHPEFNYVPIFWMATEDHDFEEINHFYFKGKKYSWERSSRGAVGRMDLTGIEKVFNEFFKELPDGSRSAELKSLIENTYLNSKSLTEATRKLVQLLFGELGLLMIDGDDPELKKLMVPSFEKDLVQHIAFQKVSETNRWLSEKNYQVQVNPREINLFYLANDSVRERIVFQNNEFVVLNTDYKFSQQEIIQELNKHPEKFSPNVVLRPLYQETVLPNIAYIGGSGESAYWLELKSFFEEMQIPFPIVVIRNSILILNAIQNKKIKKLNINYQDLMLSIQKLINKNINEHSEVRIDFEKYERLLTQMFDELNTKAGETDVSFSKMVAAQRSKQLKGLDKMIKRLSHAEKKKQSDRVSRIEELYNEIFPLGELQERVMNFSEVWLNCGPSFRYEVLDELKAFDFCFTIKTFDC